VLPQIAALQAQSFSLAWLRGLVHTSASESRQALPVALAQDAAL